MKKLFLLLLFACVPVMAQDVPKSAQESPYDAAGLQVKPKYEGGFEAFYSFISNEIRVPKADSAEGIHIKVYVSFVIEKDGSVSDVKALRDPGYGMADEAVRVVKLTDKKWTAGVQDGKPVRAMFTLPISINVDGTGKTEKKKE